MEANLKARVTTAIVFVLIMFCGIFGGAYPFLILFSLITLLTYWEYLGLVLGRENRRFPVRSIYGAVLAYIPFLFTGLHQSGLVVFDVSQIAGLCTLYIVLICGLFILELGSLAEYPFRNLAYIILGLPYIGFSLSLLNFLAFQSERYYLGYVLGLVLMVWSNDSAAYFAGTYLGKHRIAPRLSPKKTWEGFFGGVVFVQMVATALYFIFPTLALWQWLALGATVSLFGTLGDLVESMLKRSVHIKDSGTILPGHGGLLDRFDAFIFTIPFFTILLMWFQNGYFS